MLQEAFIKIFTQLHQYRNEGSLEGWIRRIIVHTCINIIKKNKKFSETVDIVHANSLIIQEDFIPSIMQAKQVVECIRLLPIGYRTVLNLYAIEGYSPRDITDAGDRRKYEPKPVHEGQSIAGGNSLKRKIISKPRERMAKVISNM